jgi:hypothetical protein
VNMRPQRSTWVLMASFVLTLVIYLMVRPAPVVTYPYYPVPVTNSPAEPRSRPTLDMTSTEPSPASTTTAQPSPLASTVVPTPPSTVGLRPRPRRRRQAVLSRCRRGPSRQQRGHDQLSVALTIYCGWPLILGYAGDLALLDIARIVRTIGAV